MLVIIPSRVYICYVTQENYISKACQHTFRRERACVSLWKSNSTTYVWAQQRDRLCRWDIKEEKKGVNGIGTSVTSKNSTRKMQKDVSFLLKFLERTGARTERKRRRKRGKKKKKGTAVLSIFARDVLLRYISIPWWANLIIYATTKNGVVRQRHENLRGVKFCNSLSVVDRTSFARRR